MSLFIHGASVLAPAPGQSRVERFGDEADPRTKRLPRVDRMSIAVARAALGDSGVEGLALVVGTGYGGLAATVDFLEGMAVRGAQFGSPTAFHESVHHAPAGQISILLNITGMSLTCSARELSGEASLKAAADLIDQGRAQRVLVVCADEVVPALEAAFRAFTQSLVPSEGAAALLLGREPSDVELVSVELAARPLPTLHFSMPQTTRELNPSGGLLRVVDAVNRLRAGPAEATEVLKSCALGGGEATTTLRRRPE